MKIKIKVHTSSSQEKINKINDDFFEVWIREKAMDNKANKYLEKFLKKYFRQNVKIKLGFTSRNKVIEVLE